MKTPTLYPTQTAVLRRMLIAGLVAAWWSSAGLAADPMNARQHAVQELKPVGYWPVDEGEGDVLHDCSGNANDGRIFQTPWKDGLLNFTSAFQWLEIPGHEKYQGKAFTIGGWLFTRQASYGGDGMLFMGMENPTRVFSKEEVSVNLRIFGGGEIQVSHGKRDVLGSKAEKDRIALDQWQHVLYTYEAGVGKLYLNGQRAWSKDKVPFESRKFPLLIGSCADWWMLHPPGSNSLDGSVRGLALFDRALTPEDVKRLRDATKPERQPRVFAADAIIIDGREIPLDTLSAASAEQRSRALEHLERQKPEAIRPMSDALLPVLIRSLEERQTRRAAAKVLVKLDREEARAALREALPRWIQTLQNERAPREERAACALALAEIKGLAKDALPALAALLERLVAKESARLPRVEDVVRNALIRALLEGDPNNEQARRVLGLALAKPLLDASDLSGPNLEKVRSLAAEGRYMDALDAYRPYKERFLSLGDPFRASLPYRPVVMHKGCTYTLGAGRPYKAVEKVGPEDFAKAVERIAVKHPEAKTWRRADHPYLCRVKIIKSDANGRKEAHLAGEDFIFDGGDPKVAGWSVAVDDDGYIHIVGGQHNRPHSGLYILGSWEKLGLSQDWNSDAFPNQMYFVSARPGDIESFEFVGPRNNPRQIPSPGYLNYMNFVQDNNGELYLYGRIDVSGRQSWGLYRYDTKTRRWAAMGGDACDVIASAGKNDPQWPKYLIRSVRGGVPSTPGAKSLVWAWQPHFYNLCRSGWGIYFDRTNRMHFRAPIRGLDASAHIIDSDVYAWSDDCGRTFHRADGSTVKLPLTVNPAPEHNADVRNHFTGVNWDLWLSLLRSAGY